jgi:hypothetical protein
LLFSSKIVVLFVAFFVLGGFASGVEPGRIPGVPPDIEAMRNFGKYELNVTQREFLKNPVVPGEGRVRVAFPEREGETLRIRIVHPLKCGLTGPDDVTSYLRKFAHIIGFDPRSHELRYAQHSVLAENLEIWVFQQYLQGAPVSDARVIVRARPGHRPNSITGIFFRDISIDNRKTISESDAIGAALNGLDETLDALKTRKSALILFPYDKGLRWAYRLGIETDKGPFLIFIDAESGMVLERTFQLLPGYKPE